MVRSSDIALAATAFVAMELVAYLGHRFVMHGVGMILHRSHHRSRTSGFEANDAFPVFFAALTVMGMAAGSTWPSFRPVLVVGCGVTAYGAAYAFVHDVYIHRRLPWFSARWRPLEYLKDSHRIHHLYGGEPYGMLLPVVPADLRARARTAAPERDPFARGAPASTASTATT